VHRFEVDIDSESTDVFACSKHPPGLACEWACSQGVSIAAWTCSGLATQVPADRETTPSVKLLQTLLRPYGYIVVGCARVVIIYLCLKLCLEQVRRACQEFEAFRSASAHNYQPVLQISPERSARGLE
jgi:hypothetical protein